jgi:protein-S-isoprenylcysteine O-methyltransferase Ste14
MMTDTISNLRLCVRMVLGWAVFAAMLLVPAGTWRWTEAWLFLAVYVVWGVPVVVWLKRNNPELLKERMKGPFQRAQKGWDRAILLAFILPTIGLYVLPGLDAVRFGWSRVPVAVNVLGFLGMLPALGLIFLTMRENTFLSPSVRIQSERGHTVVTTGPYSVVRHPMYVGVTLLLLCTPLALGSLWALIPAALLLGLLVMRTVLEDRTLQAELPGYSEYAQKVRCKLLPGVW